MNILALDTSTEFCSAALWQDGRVSERGEIAGQSHSTRLQAMIDELLAEAGLGVHALDGIAYGEGPGSFTGLRIATAVTQGLAFAADVPVLGVGTLHALAVASGASRVWCCLDARMQEIYHAVYVLDAAGWQTVSAPAVGAPLTVPLPAGEGWTGCGNGFAAYGELLQQRLGGKLQALRPELFPHARDMVALAQPLFAAGRGLPAERAAPIYIRDKVALKTAER